MTNHSESTGSSENGDISGRDADSRTPGGAEGRAPDPEDLTCTAYDSHGDGQQVTLRSPAELADALPYLLGYRPEDSIVLVALHDKDGRGRFGGRARLGIPDNPDDWPSAGRQLAQGLVKGSERRGVRPEQMVVFLCREPGRGESGRQVKERLGPLARILRLECGALDIPVVEALCVSGGRFWSYCCDDEGCCPGEGTPMGLPGTSVLAAAATYAGLQVRGTLSELRARLLPWEYSAAREQEAALDAAGQALIPRILDAEGRAEVAEETLRLAERILRRFATARPVSGVRPADLRDDELLGHDEAAKLILGLQDRTTRDRAAGWMEDDEAAPALRLWRALSRRCVGAYGEHAAAPLTLAGWVAWSTGDELEAREALAMALGADPDYLFARLLHQACNEGLDPESIRHCLRSAREDRGETGAEPGQRGDREPPAAEPGVPDPGALPPLPRRPRTRTPGTGGVLPRRNRAEGGRPGRRVPHPRASVSSRHPAADGGARPGGAGEKGTRPGTAGPGTSGPGARRRRGSSQPGAQAGHQHGDGEE
ncbi:DUF4192 domain-containing protein [Streptomyces sp. NRRL WC-3626]|uniref:DUF4192 domain-containing protein n=1 Tax=Streptomyces sp. NRRL WC-3626 TaxID=1463926 RepID=UPI00068ABE0A|nr:DUF4192 domain-containing protein [Streptomyces sp. NRRL WC-3626]